MGYGTPRTTPTVVQAARGLIDGRPFGIVNVTEFGATGDGATDDTAAIQAALDLIKAAGGGVLRIPKGTYMLSASLLVPSNCVIEGDGDDTVLKVSEGSYNGEDKFSVLLNENYEDLSFPANEHITVRNLKVDGSYGDSIAPANEMEGIDWVRVQHFLIENVTVVNAIHDGIDLDSCKDGAIRGCHIADCNWAAIHAGDTCERIRAEGNDIARCGAGRVGFDEFYAGLHNDSVDGFIVNNRVVDCPRGILAAGTGGLTLIQGNVVRGTTTDYAIDCRASRARIVNNVTHETSDANIGAITFTGTGGVIQGNTIRTAKVGITVNAAAPVTVIGNNVTWTARTYGIRLQGAAHIVQNNYVETRPSAASGRGAIQVEATAPGSVVAGNNIGATGSTPGRAIRVLAANVVVTGNVCSAGGAVDIEADAADVLVTGNRCPGATTAAVVVGSSGARVLVDGNNFHGSAAGISDSGSDTEIGTNINPAA